MVEDYRGAQYTEILSWSWYRHKQNTELLELQKVELNAPSAHTLCDNIFEKTDGALLP